MSTDSTYEFYTGMFLNFKVQTEWSCDLVDVHVTTTVTP